MAGFDQFKDTYFNECFELLSKMEEMLLGIDVDAGADLEVLNAIFRCIHSIKGGGGAFGLDEIVSFTHIAEALLDVMRDGKVPATQGAIDALLRSVDVTSQMIRLAREGKPVPAEMGKDLAAELNALAVAGGQTIAVPKGRAAAKKNDEVVKFYHISFVPERSMLLSGNEPIFIIRELKKLGKVKVKTDISTVPALHEIEPDQAYLAI
jgi:two-component system chemotaxis sensor kinase CheA